MRCIKFETLHWAVKYTQVSTMVNGPHSGSVTGEEIIFRECDGLIAKFFLLPSFFLHSFLHSFSSSLFLPTPNGVILTV